MSEAVPRSTYIHGTDPSEQARLAGLNRLTNAAFRSFLDVPARARVLEVGSGLGLLAAEVADSEGGVRVTGVESSPEQLASAAAAPRVAYVQGDGHALPFPDGCFDLAYARYLLEHVADPAAVVGEMRRVVRRGGRVAACENDISLLRMDPACPAFEDVWRAFGRYQERLGGDGMIGRRLYRLFRRAGFSDVVLSVQPEVHWQGSPGFSAWVQNIIGNVESARRGLVEAGFCDGDQIGRAVDELLALTLRTDASSLFVWNRAVATR